MSRHAPPHRHGGGGATRDWQSSVDNLLNGAESMLSRPPSAASDRGRTPAYMPPPTPRRHVHAVEDTTVRSPPGIRSVTPLGMSALGGGGGAGGGVRDDPPDGLAHSHVSLGSPYRYRMPHYDDDAAPPMYDDGRRGAPPRGLGGRGGAPPRHGSEPAAARDAWAPVSRPPRGQDDAVRRNGHGNNSRFGSAFGSSSSLDPVVIDDLQRRCVMGSSVRGLRCCVCVCVCVCVCGVPPSLAQVHHYHRGHCECSCVQVAR